MNGMLKLCYVDGPWAYFTTQDLSSQWGDDWNDAPYECNAGLPLTPHESIPEEWNKDGTPKWEVIRVAFDGPFKVPCDGYFNSPYSVADINKGVIPWLRTEEWVRPAISVNAGTPLATFIDAIQVAGGEVFMLYKPFSPEKTETRRQTIGNELE